ncbi:hypothetical protein F5B20DRAFT_543852 [Whalleya microplaca]|nr:hypothetical protein F5B20DRAFT_543852 [Whalleya microplaca]
MSLSATTLEPWATLPPLYFANLFPSCAKNCEPFLGADSACYTGPIDAINIGGSDARIRTWITCYCKYNEIQSFLDGTSGLCEEACPDNAKESSAEAWLTELCGLIPSVLPSSTRSPALPTLSSGLTISSTFMIPTGTTSPTSLIFQEVENNTSAYRLGVSAFTGTILGVIAGVMIFTFLV